jgi:hypothetical protein
VHHDERVETRQEVALAPAVRSDPGQRAEHPALPGVVVLGVGGPKRQPSEQPHRISIHGEGGLASGVTDHCVSGLRPNAPGRQQLATQQDRLECHQALEPTVPLCQCEERAQLERLLAVLPARPDEFLELLRAERTHRLRCQRSSGHKPFDRALDVRPHGVLHKDAAHRDLERVSIGPPVPTTPGVH